MTNDDRPLDPERGFEDPATAWVSEELRHLGQVEPPRTLVSTVMKRIAEEPLQADSPRLDQPAGGGTMMARKVLWGVIAVAAGFIVSFVFFGVPPVEFGTSGTIGAAKRYQAEQISKSDVKTGDTELQAFLQSDTFQKIASDKAARTALTSKEFRTAVADPAVRAALATPAVAQALASQAVMQALSSASFQQAMAQQGVQAALASSAFQQAIASSAFQQALASQAFQQALASSAFQQALASQAFQQAMASQAFQQALASSAFQQALASQGFFMQADQAIAR